MKTRIKSLAKNRTELHRNGDVFFFSYETLVAANVDGRFYRSSQKYSVTTSKHVNQWLDGVNATEVPQSELDAMLDAPAHSDC